MNLKYLFPNSFKKIGWILLVPGLVLGVHVLITEITPPFFDWTVFALIEQQIFEGTRYFQFIETNVYNEIIGLMVIFGLMFAAFSREKDEDEFIAKVRMESLVWATYVNYGILVLSIIFLFEMTFMWVFIFNMFTILIFFLIRYYWMIFKSKRMSSHEE